MLNFPEKNSFKDSESSNSTDIQYSSGEFNSLDQNPSANVKSMQFPKEACIKIKKSQDKPQKDPAFESSESKNARNSLQVQPLSDKFISHPKANNHKGFSAFFICIFIASIHIAPIQIAQSLTSAEAAPSLPSTNAIISITTNTLKIEPTGTFCEIFEALTTVAERSDHLRISKHFSLADSGKNPNLKGLQQVNNCTMFIGFTTEALMIWELYSKLPPEKYILANIRTLAISQKKNLAVFANKAEVRILDLKLRNVTELNLKRWCGQHKCLIKQAFLSDLGKFGVLTFESESFAVIFFSEKIYDGGVLEDVNGTVVEVYVNEEKQQVFIHDSANIKIYYIDNMDIQLQAEFLEDYEKLKDSYPDLDRFKKFFK